MASEYSTNTWEVAACDNGAGFTLRERESGQLMHSMLGPWFEANHVYVQQSELDRRILQGSETKPLVIYDIGLGIAANSVAAISGFSQMGSLRRPVQIYSFEKYPEALAGALKTPAAFSFLADYLEPLRTLLKSSTWSTPDGRISWSLVPGDFRELDLSTFPLADLVYFDFYAPAVAPELWGYGMFSKIFPKVSPQDGLLITYSSTKAVRTAMLLAGFFVGDGVPTPMKHETTLASPSRVSLRSPLTREWLSRLDRSAKPLPPDWPESRRDEGMSQVRLHPQFQP
jgi:queuine tRNA-ribosyltransferase